ncbi:F-box only protein 34 [Plectropomus leopardus]|uniref:F-box only protein 34 n=1 Tax=Plectropomus leopardus TaxID=160734 RepID=UPI001C4C6FC6|nr:F-box only protein 34 [Plectropomus leopardus]
MHLKSYPKLVRSELRLDASGVQTSQRSSLLIRTCGGNHGNSSSRLPLSIISTNTLHRGNATNSSASSGVATLWLKPAPGAALQLLPPTPGCENDTLRLYQTAAEDADAPLDIWTVIKPGHVREKIAIFASDGEHTDGVGGSEHISTGGSDNRDRTPAVCSSHATMSGLLRAVKAKGSWEENSSAKRRRRSGNTQNLQQDPRSGVHDAQQHAHQPSPRRSDSTPRLGGDVMTAAEEEQQKVSVVEMVAFLEQRASEQQPDSKPQLALQRSSTSITLSRAPPPEVRGEEPESVRVSDMVARLESECLRRRTEGDLSRSNSLRRTVGRVLLAAAGDLSSAPCQPSAPPPSSSALAAQSAAQEPISCSETARTPSSALTTPPSAEAAAKAAGGAETLSTSTMTQTEAPPLLPAPPPSTEEAEPVPGLLFLSPAASEPHPPHHTMTFDLEPRPTPGSQSENRRRRKAVRAAEEEREADGVTSCSGVAPLSRRASASQDFLEMRQRLQQLLEPQPYLAVLPHHLLLKILRLLPTQSLAALKCTCHYFQFIIDTYGVRPADSLWVSDPRYHDDPCKQCKKRYGRGDVSLCRWHHKPYCQALPYGPGYWMCCHGAHRDAPGCNVGLHDNRWVPAFHSINVPIYRRSCHDN